MPSQLTRIVQWLIIVAMPLFLGFSAIELMVNNAQHYVRYEYAKANFPPDLAQINEVVRQQLGLEPFSREQREQLALVAVDYLQRPQPAERVIFLLEQQTLPGSDRPLYDESEISHMIDVKHLTDAIGRLNYAASFIVLGGLLILAVQGPYRQRAFRALLGGGLATMIALLLLGLFIVLGWSIFFVQFHELLFPPGTWQFAYSDSLIRLFPEKFWFDFGVLTTLLTFALGALTAFVGWVLSRASANRPEA